VAELEALGFIWKTNAWEQGFSGFSICWKTDRHCILKPEMRNWIARQRTEHQLFQKDKKSSMTKERIQKLESIAFVFRPSQISLSDMERIQKFQESSTSVPTSDPASGPILLPTSVPTSDPTSGPTSGIQRINLQVHGTRVGDRSRIREVAEEWFRKNPYWLPSKFLPLQVNYLQYSDIKEKSGETSQPTVSHSVTIWQRSRHKFAN
jgi:hypothetical protein